MRMTRWAASLPALILVLVTAVSVAGYGSGAKESAKPAGGNPLDKSALYSISVLTTDPKAQQLQEQNSFRKLLKEKFNFNYDYLVWTGDPLEYLSLRLASGDYPDLICLKNEKFVKAYVEAGALLPLDDLIDKYGPNLKQTHKDRIPYWRVMSGLDDGKLWFYTAVEPAMSYGVSVAVNEWKIRSDILEQQGYPDIRNEDDVFAVVKRGLRDNPVTNGQPTVGFGTPLRDPNSIECASYFFNTGRLSHMTYKHNTIFDINQNVFIDPATDEDFKAGLVFYNKMWREGLVDKDCLTYSSADFQNKMATGYGLATFFYGWNWGSWNQKLAQAGQKFRYVPIPGVFKQTTARGEKKIYPITNGEIWSSFSITKNAKFPARLMEVINWCMSEEGLVRAGWGEAGVQYTIGKNGMRVPTAQHMQKASADPNYDYTWRGDPSFGLFAGLDKNGQNYQMSADNEYLKATVDPKVTEVYGHYGWADVYESHNKNKNFKADFAYPAGFSMVIPSYADQQLKNSEKITVATLDYTIKLITAGSVEKFEQLYNELIQKRKDLGIQALLDERNKLYKTLMAKVTK